MPPLVTLLVYLSIAQVGFVAVIAALALFSVPRDSAQEEKGGAPLPSH